MKLQEFDYDLPQELIAQYPLKKRDKARLLIIDRDAGRVYHDRFFNILKYLPKQSLLILNDSKVIPARLMGRRSSGGSVEIFLLKRLSDGYSYKTLIRPLKRIKLNEKIIFDGGRVTAELKDPLEKIVRFNIKDFSEILKLGCIPLPPYIKREPNATDKTYYQTIYAKRAGSVASPTAGLHFSKEQLKKIRKSGIKIESVTLHINYATFNPVKEESIVNHKMHSEDYEVSLSTIKNIRENKSNDRRIVAVGTTSARVLEAIADRISNKRFLSGIKGSTDLFIYPGYKFKLVDSLITNFHQPRTTLFMLVCAFAGRDLVKRAYEEAIKMKYRFYSYGDAMLIL